MVSKEFLIKLNTIINPNGEYSEEEIVYIGDNIILFYKTIEKIMHRNVDGKSNKNTTKEV
jgi:hypothetical protein